MQKGATAVKVLLKIRLTNTTIDFERQFDIMSRDLQNLLNPAKTWYRYTRTKLSCNKFPLFLEEATRK